MSVKAVVNHCTLTHFDAYQCGLSHLPHIPDWIWPTIQIGFWAIVVLFVLSVIERLKNLIVIVWTVAKWLLGPGVQLLVDAYQAIKKWHP